MVTFCLKFTFLQINWCTKEFNFLCVAKYKIVFPQKQLYQWNKMFKSFGKQLCCLFQKMIFLEVIDGFQTFPETMGVCGDQLR